MSKTHYETLGVSETAAQAEIKRVYRRFARKYHPDRNKNKSDEERFKEITSAYFVIGDPGRRQIYDYDLRQSRKAGGASGSSAAGASAPPPPPPHSSGFSSGAGAQAAPPPPPPPGSSRSAAGQTSSPPSPPASQGAYRYLFFFRGVLVGGGVVGVILLLILSFYVACRSSSATPVSSAPLPQSASVAKTEEPAIVPVPTESAPTAAEPTPAIPELTPATSEPTPRREPDPATPAPTPVTPEPTPTTLDPTRVSSPVHLCGKWRGSLDWFGTRVPFVMRLEQRGNEISGTSTEGHAGRIWRATVHGTVTGSTVTLVKTFADTGSTVILVSSDSSSGLLRGTWETPQSRGSWQAAWESDFVPANDHRRDDSWRSRPGAPHRDRPRNDCWYGWYMTPDGNRVRCYSRWPPQSP